MNNFDNDDFVPDLKPLEGAEKPKIALRSEGPAIEGQKKCPHCERMVPEKVRICPQCGFDTISGKTQQQRAKKGVPIKALATITVLGALACAGYVFKEDLINLVSKTDTEEVANNNIQTDGEVDESGE
ncbi:MAG: hypothetical protein ACRC37_06005 [Lentisphaeria bacterium]